MKNYSCHEGAGTSGRVGSGFAGDKKDNINFCFGIVQYIFSERVDVA